MDFGFIGIEVIDCDKFIEKLMDTSSKLKMKVASGTIEAHHIRKYKDIINPYDIKEKSEKRIKLRIEAAYRKLNVYEQELRRMCTVQREMTAFSKEILTSLKNMRGEDINPEIYNGVSLYTNIYKEAIRLKYKEYRSYLAKIVSETNKWKNKKKDEDDK